MLLGSSHPLLADSTASSSLVRALTGDRPGVTPVWFMRQAGRSLPEYRALRTGTGMLDACLDPELASEITLQPVRRHGVDAAILFSDIVVPLALLGVHVTIEPGRGPVFAQPVRGSREIAALTAMDPDEIVSAGEPVWDAVRRTVDGLRALGEARGDSIPLIGFAGAPFTLAAYLVDGGPSKDQWGARTLMRSDPSAFADLLAWLAEVTGLFLRTQVESGASAGQLFDTWAGSLPPDSYAQHAAPASARVLALAHQPTYTPPGALERSIPLVHFGVGTGELLPEMRDAGADAMGIDYRIPLDEASRRLGGETPLQGNLDPSLLAASDDLLDAAVLDVLERGLTAPAHVFNLGHGVPPSADPDRLTRIVDVVHAWRRPSGRG